MAKVNVTTSIFKIAARMEVSSKHSVRPHCWEQQAAQKVQDEQTKVGMQNYKNNKTNPHFIHLSHQSHIPQDLLQPLCPGVLSTECSQLNHGSI